MKRLFLIAVTLLGMIFTGQAQNNVGINDDNSSPKASAMLDVFSTSKGMLIPRIALTSTTVAAPVTTPEASLLVYNTATISDVSPGYYYWNGSSQWVRLVVGSDPKMNFNFVQKSADDTLLITENMVFASGDIILTLPIVTSADDGLEISIKNVGAFTDLITIVPEVGKTIDATPLSKLTRWRGRTFIAMGSNWIIKEKETRADNLLDVSPSASFKTIAEVVAFLNEHMAMPAVVRLGGGTFTIDATQTINLPYPVTFEGISYGESLIDAAAAVSGSPLFSCASECYFKKLVFNAISNGAGNDAIRFTGSGIYHEVKDCGFFGFNKGVVATTNSDLWIFENDFEDCTGAGIEINAGAASGGRLRVSETDFVQCATGINLLSGVSEKVSIINCAFYNTSSGTDIGILYTPASFTSFAWLFITHNAWNNEGTFSSGFDFTRTDGRDANAYMMNNLGEENENPHCKLNLINNTTSVAANGTSYVKASWTTSSPTLTSHTCKWNIATTNRLVYQSVQKSDVVMWVSGNVSTSNINRVINVGICKNGVTTTRYGETTVRTQAAGQPYQFSTIIYLQAVGATDYYEIWFNSTAGVTDNIIFADLNWYVEAK